MNKKIIQIDFLDGHLNPQSYKIDDFKSMTEHRARGEGDKWFYDVETKKGQVQRIFNPSRVIFE